MPARRRPGSEGGPVRMGVTFLPIGATGSRSPLPTAVGRGEPACVQKRDAYPPGRDLAPCRRLLCYNTSNMKLVIAVVQGQDADTLLHALREANFRLTIVDSVGGFLRERNATILVGVEENRLDDLWRIITTACHTRLDF